MLISDRNECFTLFPGPAGTTLAGEDIVCWLEDSFGESRESVLVCLDPENTFRCDCFVLVGGGFWLLCSLAMPDRLMGLKGQVSLTGLLICRSCSICLISFFFLDVSCNAHCFFNFSRSDSALSSSSFSSRTRRSCPANAVRNAPESPGSKGRLSGDGGLAGKIGVAGSEGERITSRLEFKPIDKTEGVPMLCSAIISAQVQKFKK